MSIEGANEIFVKGMEFVMKQGMLREVNAKARGIRIVIDDAQGRRENADIVKINGVVFVAETGDGLSESVDLKGRDVNVSDFDSLMWNGEYHLCTLRRAHLGFSFACINHPSKKEPHDRMTQPDQETTEMIADSLARTVSNVFTTEATDVTEGTAAEPFICRCTKCIREYSDRVQKKTESLCHKLYVLFTKHPHEHNMSYTQHALRALRMALRMGKGAFALCVHSLFPFLCEKTGTNVIDRLYQEIHPKQE